MNTDPVSHAADGTPYRWRDPEHDRIHAAEGFSLLAGEDPLKFEMWTRCGWHDIPANAAWAGRDTLTCEECFAVESDDHAEPAEIAGEDRPTA